MSPELETLDQLLGGDLTLRIVRTYFPSDDAFAKAVLGLLKGGDVRLLNADESEVPHWRWRGCFSGGTADRAELRLDLTEQGVRRIS